MQLPDSELDVEVNDACRALPCAAVTLASSPLATWWNFSLQILPVWDDSCSVELVARGQVGSADAGLHKEELVQVAASQHTEGTVPTTNVAITAPGGPA